MNEIEQEELLYNKIYEQTKEFGRTHFVSEIMRLNRENKKYKHVIEEIEKICASVPEDWTICGVEKIYEIEQFIAEVNK